jgi:CheY-like chemotaxis protein
LKTISFSLLLLCATLLRAQPNPNFQLLSTADGLRRGADAYLSKPFHQEELLVTLENLLALYQEEFGEAPSAVKQPAK